MSSIFELIIHSVLELFPISSSLRFLELGANLANTINLHIFSGMVHLPIFAYLFKDYYKDLRNLFFIPSMLFSSAVTLLLLNLIINQQFSLEVISFKYLLGKNIFNLCSNLIFIFLYAFLFSKIFYKNSNLEIQLISQNDNKPFLDIKTSIFIGIAAILSLFFSTSRTATFMIILQLRKHSFKNSMIYAFIFSNIYNVSFFFVKFNAFCQAASLQNYATAYVLSLFLAYITLRFLLFLPQTVVALSLVRAGVNFLKISALLPRLDPIVEMFLCALWHL